MESVQKKRKLRNGSATCRKEKSSNTSEKWNPFSLQDFKITVGGKDFHVNKAQLMLKSEVFKKLFSYDFKEKSADSITLPETNAKSFWYVFVIPTAWL